MHQSLKDKTTIKPHAIKLQNAMEYLATYGWVILVIAIIIVILFELGIFNLGGPSVCVAQAGYTCTNPVYGTNAITFTVGQQSGQYYYDVGVFVAAQDQKLNPISGAPENLTTATIYPVANIIPSGGTAAAIFPAGPTGGIQENAPIGTSFSGYVWIAYCPGSPCSNGVPNITFGITPSGG